MPPAKYAPAGYQYAHVSTPSIFREYLLPAGQLTGEQERHYQALKDLAERHGTHIEYTLYDVG